MMHEIVGNYRLFWIRIGDIFSEKEIPFDKVDIIAIFVGKLSGSS